MIWGLWVFAAITLAFAWWRFYFFMRDPKRSPPAGEHLIVAPADGRVTYVKRVQQGDVPIAIKERRSIALSEVTSSSSQEDGYLIGIFMSPFSVHRNRSPVSGEVVLRTHRPAPKNLSMARMFTNVYVGRKPPEVDCAYLIQNERLTIGIKTPAGPIVTATQIADAWVNRIVARVALGDNLARGQQYGLIRLGSQVDTFIPASLIDRILVQPGQHVRAGESVLAEARRARTPLRSRFAGPDDNESLLELSRRNPMVMAVTAYTDRSPDYFGLHTAMPGSAVFVADDGGTVPAAACSAMAHSGRVGERIVPLIYGTDLIKNGASNQGRAVVMMLDACTDYALERNAFAYFAVNEGNDRMMKVARRRWAFKLATLDYVDVMLLGRARLDGRYTFSRADSDEKLARALELLNQRYAKHQLYEPLDVATFEQQARRFKGMTRANVLCAERDGELVAAALVFDPTPFSVVRLLKLDAMTSVLSVIVRAVHAATGLFFSPPRLGEAFPTWQLRRFAARADAERPFFDYICNEALAAGARCLNLVEDRRAAIKFKKALVFRYPFSLFGVARAFDRKAWLEDAPVFYDVTYS